MGAVVSLASIFNFKIPNMTIDVVAGSVLNIFMLDRRGSFQNVLR